MVNPKNRIGKLFLFPEYEFSSLFTQFYGNLIKGSLLKITEKK